MKVASLVRTGKTSKEIAEALGVSASAIDFHRKKLRKKLGLSNTSSNLRTYLLSLH
ncbi:MAG: LuxR C-terminal-related transcriptional regulator [Proteobacteria bacterium]|nr:LuxR C-terminal-related transcriptional regulator [Pseudomonadota bacterium]MBU4294719.1 LuxR C-terminal-related transcriptional regulator [Pseudomonadota bacterium]